MSNRQTDENTRNRFHSRNGNRSEFLGGRRNTQSNRQEQTGDGSWRSNRHNHKANYQGQQQNYVSRQDNNVSQERNNRVLINSFNLNYLMDWDWNDIKNWYPWVESEERKIF